MRPDDDGDERAGKESDGGEISELELATIAANDTIFSALYDMSQAVEGGYKHWVLLGSGAYAYVVRLRSKDTGRFVIAKIFKHSITDEYKDVILREVENAQKIHSPYVCRVRRAFFSDEQRIIDPLAADSGIARYTLCKRNKPLGWIEMDYAPGKNLFKYLNDQKEQPAHKKEAYPIAIALFHALQAAHTVGISHRDIKPENLMIPKEKELPLVVLDWGISKAEEAIRLSMTPNSTGTGWKFTARYAPPESIPDVGREYGPPGDIFGAACVTYELFTGRFPWPQRDDADWSDAYRRATGQLGEAILAGDIIPELKNGKLERLLAQCLRFDPAERPAAAECLELLTSLAQEDLSSKTVSAALPMPDSSVPVTRAPIFTPRRYLWIGGAVGVIATIAAGVMLATHSQRGAAPIVPAAAEATTAPTVSPTPRIFDAAVEGGMVQVTNVGAVSLVGVKAIVRDSKGIEHEWNIDALGAGESVTAWAAKWKPALDETPGEVIVRLANESYTLSLWSPNKLSLKREGEVLILEALGELKGVTLSFADSRGQLHTYTIDALGAGETVTIWSARWKPALKDSLPQKVNVDVGGLVETVTIS
jgi:serine/threonine protein kinase